VLALAKVECVLACADLVRGNPAAGRSWYLRERSGLAWLCTQKPSPHDDLPVRELSNPLHSEEVHARRDVASVVTFQIPLERLPL
jgi:hypothetical protein